MKNEINQNEANSSKLSKCFISDNEQCKHFISEEDCCKIQNISNKGLQEACDEYFNNVKLKFKDDVLASVIMQYFIFRIAGVDDATIVTKLKELYQNKLL